MSLALGAMTDTKSKYCIVSFHDCFVLWWLTFKDYFMSATVPASELNWESSFVQTLLNQTLGTEDKLPSHCWTWPCPQIEHLLFQVTTAAVANMCLSPDCPQSSPWGQWFPVSLTVRKLLTCARWQASCKRSSLLWPELMLLGHSGVGCHSAQQISAHMTPLRGKILQGWQQTNGPYVVLLSAKPYANVVIY